MLEWTVISAAVAPHIKKYVTEKAAKLASGYADSTAAKLYKRLMPDQKLQKAVESFVGAFDKELRSTIQNPTLTGPAYHDALKIFLADYDVLEALEKPLDAQSELDWDLLKRRWAYLLDSKGQHLVDLPQEFDWDELATRYRKSLQKQALFDPELREVARALADLRTAAASEQLAGPASGFDLAGYREFLRKKCSALQLAVMHTSTYQYDRKITLWSVFIPQSARESAPLQEIPYEIGRRLREEGHLARERDERRLEEFRRRYQASAISPVLEILGRARLAVVLGNPGSGKTSLLKYLALRWVNEKIGRLPLFVDLREYIKERTGLPEYFATGSANHRLDAREVDKRLKAAEAAIFLDGLDEIFDPSIRGAVISEIVALSSRYPKLQIIVTSRSFGYEPERLQNSGFLHATLEDFDAQQRKDFLRRWHEIAEDEPNERTRLQSRIERALEESIAIRELAGNPLLLTMMAILNRNQELPRDRVELYNEASRVLLGEWDTSRDLPMDDFARQEKKDLLRELAGEMQQAEGGLAGNLIERSRLLRVIKLFLSGLGIQDSYSKAQKIVDQLTKRNFILAYAGADRFSFVHRTFLEYYCALWFVDRFEKKQVITLEQLCDEAFAQHWKDESWHEVLRLITGMLEEKKAEKLVLFLVSLDGRNEKFANLILAADCLYEIRNRRQMQTTDNMLWQKFVSEVIRYDAPYYFAPWMEVQEAAPIRQTAVARIARTWRGEKAHHWLVMAARHDQDQYVRQAAIRELVRGWKEGTGSLQLLKDCLSLDESAIVQRTAIEEIASGWANDLDILSLLKDAVRLSAHPTIWQGAIEGIARGWKDDVGTAAFLTDIINSNADWPHRQTALRELARGWKEDDKTLSVVKRCLEDKSKYVRQSALLELTRGWRNDPQTLPTLKKCARDQDGTLRSTALSLLSADWPEDTETFVLLKEWAKSDAYWEVRLTALRELARNWKENPETRFLLESCASESNDKIVQQVAIQELARGWKKDFERWLKTNARSSPDENVRKTAVQELARYWKGDPETLPLLKHSIYFDADLVVRETALHALARGWHGDSETLTILKDRVRSDKAGLVRRAALRELARGWKSDSETLLLLKSSAQDNDEGVREAVVSELARGWEHDPETLLLLKNYIQLDKSETVRSSALGSLVRTWKDSPVIFSLLNDRIRCDQSEEVRQGAAYFLVQNCKNHPETLPLLKVLANTDKSEYVRKRVAAELARGWPSDPEVAALFEQHSRHPSAKDTG